nr:hypothetical protein [Tanacetum cinerariifolium]
MTLDTNCSVKKKQFGSDKTKTSPTTKGKRLKTSAKEAKPAKKKQPTKTSKAKGLTVLSDVALTEAEQMKLATKRSLTEFHNSHASGSVADEGIDDDAKIKSNDNDDDDDDADNQDDDYQEHDDQDNVNEQTDSDNDDSDEEIQGANVEEENMDEEATNKEDEVNELYRDVNVNLEGRDTKMTDASLTNVQGTQVTEDTHVIITNPVNPKGQRQSSFVSSGFVFNMLNPGPDTGIDSVFNINTESTSLVEVSVTTIAEEPLSAAITLPPPPTPLITHLQQTPVPTPAIMNEAVKIVVQLQSDRLKDEAQAKNEVFINKLNDNIKKIIKDQVKEQVKAQVSKILPKIEKTVNEQLNAEVLTRSSNESKTSHTIVANLSELEL